MLVTSAVRKNKRMASLPQDKLDALETRFQYVEAALSGGAGPDEFVKFSKEHAELAPIVGEIRAYNKALSDRAEAEVLLKSGDKDMAEMAEAEISELDEKIEAPVPGDPHPAAAQGRGRRKVDHPRNPWRHRRRRGGSVRGRPVPHV